MNQFMMLLSIHQKHILLVRGLMPLPKYLCESTKTHHNNRFTWTQRVCITAIKNVTDMTLHVICLMKAIFGAGINWWKSHLNIRLINLIVITVFRGTKKGLHYLWPVLDMNWAYVCLLGIFKPVWSLILQKDFYFGLCVLP